MFSGERINLRPQRREDSELISKYQSEPDVSDNLSMGYSLGPTKDMVEHWYEHGMKNKDGFGFAIETKEGEYIGGCFSMWLNWKNGTTYLAIVIGHPDYRSKGYGTEAMKLFLNFLFNELGLRKVKLNVFDFNKRAIRSYEKSGFKIDGINKEELFRNGKYHDTYAMSITREEFYKGGCEQCKKEA